LCTRVCVCVYVHICVHICVCVCVRACARAPAHVHACSPARGGARPPPDRTAHEAHAPLQALQQMVAATGGRGRPVRAAVGPKQPTRPAHPTSPGSGLRVRSSASACGLGSSAGMACGCTSASAAARSSNSASRAVSLIDGWMIDGWITLIFIGKIEHNWITQIQPRRQPARACRRTPHALLHCCVQAHTARVAAWGRPPSRARGACAALPARAAARPFLSCVRSWVAIIMAACTPLLPDFPMGLCLPLPVSSSLDRTRSWGCVLAAA